MNSILIRIFAATLLVIVACTASDCSAQHFKGRFMQAAKARQEARLIESRQRRLQLDSGTRSPTVQFSTAGRSPYGAPIRSVAPYQEYPKYIGGFHSSHFQNIGIPPGDIGLRGNAYHWRPW